MSDGPTGSGRPVARVRELDGLRGLAALVVVLCHWSLVIPGFAGDTRGVPGDGLMNAVKYTPLEILVAGPQMVVLFFVLSGFVLALPFVAGQGPSYGRFVLRRAFRLYPVAYVGVGVAMAAVLLVGHHPLAHAPSDWLAAQWPRSVTPSAIGHSLTLLGGDPSVYDFDGVLWSLVHELRVSLILPVLVAVTAVVGAWRSCLLAACLSVALAGQPFVSVSFANTAELLVCFVTGIALARHRHLVTRLSGTRRSTRAALAAAAIVLMTSPSLADPARYPALHAFDLDLLAPTAGAAILVVLAQTPELARALRTRPLQRLGRVSYSIYVLHLPILFGLMTAVDHPSWWPFVAPIGIAFTLLAAACAERAIERPARRLGVRVADATLPGRAPTPLRTTPTGSLVARPGEPSAAESP